MSNVADIRDEVYLRILARKTLGEFSINDFTLEKTWRPWETLEKLAKSHKSGKVYVIGGSPIGMVNQSRTNMVLAEYVVHIGYQRYILDINAVAEIDGYVDFVQQLEDVCRKMVDPEQFSFTRLEYMRDPEGLPLSFLQMRDASTFEAYFSCYYNLVKP